LEWIETDPDHANRAMVARLLLCKTLHLVLWALGADSGSGLFFAAGHPGVARFARHCEHIVSAGESPFSGVPFFFMTTEAINRLRVRFCKEIESIAELVWI